MLGFDASYIRDLTVFSFVTGIDCNCNSLWKFSITTAKHQKYLNFCIDITQHEFDNHLECWTFWPFLRQYNKAGTASIHWCFVTHMCINELTLVQLMTFHLFGTKPLPEPTMTWYTPCFIQITKMFFPIPYIRKCCPQNDGNFVQASICWLFVKDHLSIKATCLERPPVYKDPCSWLCSYALQCLHFISETWDNISRVKLLAQGIFNKQIFHSARVHST